MNSTFIAVIEDGNVIEGTSIKELAKYPTASFFFRKDIHSSQTSMFPPKKTYHSYYYTPIDILGNEIEIKIGRLRLTDIGPDKIHYDKFHNRPIRFYDEEQKAIREIISRRKEISFLYTDVKANIDILKTINDWSLFQKIKEYDSIKNENERLKEEIDLLRAKNSEIGNNESSQ